MCSRPADLLLIIDPPSRSPSPCPSPSPPSPQKAPAALPLFTHLETSKGRNVTFRKTRTEISIESLARLSEAERSVLWYKDGEIESIKARERQLCEDKKLGLLKEEVNTRGLELRLSLDRQRRKYMIVQAILRAQKRYKDPKQLSNIARKCSVWSKTIAAIVAHRDYCELYEPAKVATITSFPPIDNYPLPFRPKDPVAVDKIPIPLKRPMSPTIPQRSVRPRITPLPETAC